MPQKYSQGSDKISPIGIVSGRDGHQGTSIHDTEREGQSSTANAILSILKQISISPPDAGGEFPKSPLQHLHSLPKSIIPKRRLSSSSSFDGYSGGSNAPSMDKTHKKQLVYLRGHNKLPTVRSIPSPLSRSFLITRLNSFSVFNWTVSSPKLSPLICATQGWKCHPVRKNELHCTSCHSGIIVKLTHVPDVLTARCSKKIFNNQHHADDYNQILNNTEKYELQYEFRFLDDDLDDEDDENDDIHVYETLVNSYVNRLSTDHYPTCSFLPLLPLYPKDENYYLSAKDIPRELAKFHNRLDLFKQNRDRLIGRNFQTQFLSLDEVEFLREYLRYTCKDGAEMETEMEMDDDMACRSRGSYTTDLLVNPSLDVILPALLGWELKIQTFHNVKFLLLKCECCTRRILLSSSQIESVRNIEELKPCPHRAEIPAREQPTEFDETIGVQEHGFDDEDEDEEEDIINLQQEHDSWCCMKAGWRIVLEGLRSSTDIQLKTSRITDPTAIYRNLTHL